MHIQCWTGVIDGGLAMNLNCVNIICLAEDMLHLMKISNLTGNGWLRVWIENFIILMEQKQTSLQKNVVPLMGVCFINHII